VASKKEYEAEQEAVVVRTETNIIEVLKKKQKWNFKRQPLL